MAEASMAVLSILTLVALATLMSGYGWRPGVHIGLTRRVLTKIRRRRDHTPDQKLVLTHTDAFLYGNVAADIINFKNYGGIKNHCHNWNIHERLLVHANLDLERAFILGYLCHLAADVVAHNHFIPYHFVKSLPPRVLGHSYWEALADAGTTDEEWEILADLRHDRTLHKNDRLVWQAVPTRALSSGSNKWIFNNILLLNLRRSWRELVRSARTREGRYPVDSEFFDHTLNRCVHDMMQVFDTEGLSLLKLKDPTGRQALRGARKLRRDLVSQHESHEAARRTSRRIARTAYWSF